MLGSGMGGFFLHYISRTTRSPLKLPDTPEQAASLPPYHGLVYHSFGFYATVAIPGSCGRARLVKVRCKRILAERPCLERFCLSQLQASAVSAAQANLAARSVTLKDWGVEPLLVVTGLNLAPLLVVEAIVVGIDRSS